MTATGESTEDLTLKRVRLVAERLRALNDQDRQAADHAEPPVNGTTYRGTDAEVHGAMRPGPDAMGALNFKYPVTWALRRPPALGVPDDGFPPELGMPAPVPPPLDVVAAPPQAWELDDLPPAAVEPPVIPAAVPPPPPADDAAVQPWRTRAGGDPDATQAIGLHRAAEPPTPRDGDRPRVRGIARVLPWNWFRGGRA